MTTRMRLDRAARPATSDLLRCRYINEPFLEFGGGGRHVDPKSGIARYGPRSFGSPRHPTAVRVGLIGNALASERARNWLDNSASGVLGDAKHPEFPGFQSDRGFLSQLVFDDGWCELIVQNELAEIVSIRSARERFEGAVALIDEKLRLLADRDQPPDYIVLALPDELVRRCRTVDYHLAGKGMVHRDLRRTIKAMAMQHRLPTQLLSQRVASGKDDDAPSKIAWNFFTGLYAKAGGVPWGPTGLTPGTCYVGISFYRPLGSMFNAMQTSLAQAFDEHGEGLVLRGHDFEWDAEREGSRAPHLQEGQAAELIEMVLDRYVREMKQTPRRVVVHKTSRYWPSERAGFKAALAGRVSQFDLLALEQQSTVRLIAESKYPPLRGTWFTVGDLDFLYTTGFISALKEYHALHVPSPLRVADHVGQDTAREVLLREVLILTKMNWNSARLGGSRPITLEFSRLVGEILREVPSDDEPLPQFKYYM